MKKIISIILILCIAGAGAYVSTQTDVVENTVSKISAILGVDDEQQINKQIDSFLQAYNSGDMNAALNCLSPKIRNMYKSSMNISESIFSKYSGFGISTEDIFGLSVGLTDASLAFNNREITFSDKDNAVVSAEMIYIDMGVEDSEKVELKMIKEFGKWYIKDIS